MMIKFLNIKGFVLALLVAIVIAQPLSATADDTSLRKERNFVRSGNSLFEKKRYAEAEVEYKKALEVNPSSELASYNLALSLLNQAGANENANDKDNPTSQASQLLSNLASTTSNQELASKAYYNLGNIAFNQEQYDQSIEMYKNCLRRNPDDDNARENLRLAQKKKSEQEQQQQQDNQQEDKQEQEQQQQQEQNKDEQQQQEQQQDQQQQQQQQQNQQQQSMSQENIDQILKAMQDAEQNTQQRVKEEKAKEERVRVQSEKNW